MDFPVWHIPGISKGLVIGVISVLHVFIAQFAVGGGIYLAWAEGLAHKENSPEMLAWLEGHTRFFLLLTMVFGGLSGVAIWFSMSLSSPAATSMLAHNFLFFWAAEWTFFLVEIVSLLVYYYTYPLCRSGAMSATLHVRVGWVYAVAGWMSLFLINGIITFMLTPGGSLVTGNVWDGFFNPTFWPSLAYRTALCLMLAGMFALFTASSIGSEPVRKRVTRSAAVWICLPLAALLAAGFWYVSALPPDRQAAMARRTKDIHPFIETYGWALPAVFALGVLAFIRAQRLRWPLAVVILCSGLVLSGSFEWIRETSRRSWVIPGHLYSNGVSVSEGERANTQGAAAVSGWLRALEDGTAPDPALARGALLFDQQCAACHGVNGPRLDIVPRLEKLTEVGLEAQLKGQGERLDYMPPFFGTSDDVRSLAGYLNSIRSSK